MIAERQQRAPDVGRLDQKQREQHGHDRHQRHEPEHRSVPHLPHPEPADDEHDGEGDDPAGGRVLAADRRAGQPQDQLTEAQTTRQQRAEDDDPRPLAGLVRRQRRPDLGVALLRTALARQVRGRRLGIADRRARRLGLAARLRSRNGDRSRARRRGGGRRAAVPALAAARPGAIMRLVGHRPSLAGPGPVPRRARGAAGATVGSVATHDEVIDRWQEAWSDKDRGLFAEVCVPGGRLRGPTLRRSDHRRRRGRRACLAIVGGISRRAAGEDRRAALRGQLRRGAVQGAGHPPRAARGVARHQPVPRRALPVLLRDLRRPSACASGGSTTSTRPPSSSASCPNRGSLGEKALLMVRGFGLRSGRGV